MSSKDTQVEERSEGNVKNNPELAIASSAINSKNGESTVVIDIPEKDSKPAAPDSTSPPSGSPRRTHDHQVHHGEASGGHDAILASSVASAGTVHKRRVKRAACVPGHWEGMLPTDNRDKPLIINRREISTDVQKEVNTQESSILEEEFKSLGDALVVEESQPKIQRVPSIMTGYGRSYGSYEPRMVSIGLYNHSEASPKLMEGEKLKLKLAALFVKKHGLQKDVLSKIRKEIKDLWNCYKHEVWESEETFGDHVSLTWRFFVDGCAILHHIHCAVHEDTDEMSRLKVKVDILTFMQHDLFLLENQLPYRVLDLLMSCLDNKSDMRESIEKFIFQSIGVPWEKQDEGEPPIHLLDLLRTILLSDKKDKTPNSKVKQLIKDVVEYMTEPLEKFHDSVESRGKAFENSTCLQTHFFRSLEELKAAGIRITPSNTGRLKDITYNLGTLKLPPITVDDFTASKFLNLIAYEMCPDFDNDFGVTSYILFLDALIDRAEDVKELRDKHILYNALGSDEEVAKLFNEIGANLVSNRKAYADVKSAIEKRCGNRWMTWIAQFNHKHFQSPWSVLAFLAAIIVLVSTILQTFYTIWGYYK